MQFLLLYIQQRLTTFERETLAHETKISKLNTECDTMKSYIRDLEQKNDDLERTNRVVSESVAGFETLLNQAYEKNAILEMEIDEKELMQTNLQRLMDEARGESSSHIFLIRTKFHVIFLKISSKSWKSEILQYRRNLIVNVMRSQWTQLPHLQKTTYRPRMSID